MDLALISCSGLKNPGGESDYYKESTISSLLNSNSYSHLRKLQQIIAGQIGELPGPDIGISKSESKILFLPAYKRYSGLLYQSSDFENTYPRIKNLRVLIISAFYGLIDANDLIRDYDWQMDKTLFNGRKTNTWWKNNGLGELLFEIVEDIKPTTIYDFLFAKYRAAIFPFYRKYTNNNIERIDSLPGFNSLKITGAKLSKVIKQYL